MYLDLKTLFKGTLDFSLLSIDNVSLIDSVIYVFSIVIDEHYDENS